MPSKEKTQSEIASLVRALTRKMGVHPLRRMEIDNELSSFYGAIATAYVTTFLYHISLRLLPESKAWKEAKAKPDSNGDPTARRRRGHIHHWTEAYGLTPMDKYLDRELAENHSYLYNQLLVVIWSVTEAKIDDVIVSYVLAVPKILKKDIFANLKCTIGDMVGVPSRQRVRSALRLYRESKNATFKKGMARFELLLDAVGLGGSVPQDVTRRFIEISEIRHNLVHRNGVIDNKLAAACPWLKLPVNHIIRLDREYLIEFMSAIKFYIIEIDRRIRTSFKEPIPEHAEKLYQYHLSRYDKSRVPLDCPCHEPDALVPKKNRTKRSATRAAGK